MSKFKALLFVLAHDRVVFAELEALGVDCSEEIASVNLRIEAAKRCMSVSGVIDSYRAKKRWLASDLSGAEKKRIREMDGVSSDVIAEELVN